jgi:uncharacterized protein YcbX
MPIRVTRLSISPVRSLGLEHPTSFELVERGVLEDRRFFVIDEAGRLVDQLIAGALVQVAAHTNPEATRLRLTLPDGTVIDGEVELAEPIEAEIHGRTAIGQAVVGPWAAALQAFAGRPVRIVRCNRPGGTRVANAVSLVSDGSLARLAGELGVSTIDARRFRMLIELEGASAHEEDSWIGGRIAIGSAILDITRPDARCAITTHDPDTGLRDFDILRSIIKYRGVYEDRKAIFGALGEVAVTGRVSVGDEVTVLATLDAAERQHVAAGGV